MSNKIEISAAETASAVADLDPSDEALAAMAIVGLYERKALLWDANRGRALIEATWLGRFRALLPAGGTVLDLGCGAGAPIAGHLLAHGHPVTGVDTSATLLDIARERYPQGEWRRGDMRRLRLGRRFDGLIAWDSFFHLTPEDQRAMFPIFREHLAARGALLFTSGPAHGTAMGSFGDEPLYHASLSPEEYRSLLAAEGFEVIAHTAEDSDCGGHTVWLARLRQE